MKYLIHFFGTLLGLALLIEWGFAGGLILDRRAARDLKTNFLDDDAAFFSAPVAIASDGNSLYVIDAQENEIKVFSQHGRLLKAFGGKGQGPGEFNSPADIDFCGGKIYVSDRLNYRIQILDKKGIYIDSFKVPFAPEQICVISAEKVVVSHLPLGIDGRERLVQCFTEKGKPLWEAEDSYFSGDRIYDTFRNLAILNKGGSGDFYLIRKSDERSISHFDGNGRLLGRIAVSPSYPLKKIVLPTSGRRKEIRGFCWDSAFDGGSLFLVSPKYTEERDLGPGQEVFQIRPNGSLAAIIDLPAAVKKIAVEKDKIFAVDTENCLRVFEIGQK